MKDSKGTFTNDERNASSNRSRWKIRLKRKFINKESELIEKKREMIKGRSSIASGGWGGFN